MKPPSLLGGSLLEAIFQTFAGFEYRNFLCGYFKRCSCLGVSTRAGFSLVHFKRTKSYKRDFIALFECLLDCRNYCVYCQRCFFLGAGNLGPLPRSIRLCSLKYPPVFYYNKDGSLYIFVSHKSIRINVLSLKPGPFSFLPEILFWKLFPFDQVS